MDSVENSVDKPMYKSLTNQSTIPGTIGAILLMLGEPLSKGVVLSPLQWVGYILVLVALPMYVVGSRRARGKIISQLVTQNVQLTELNNNVKK